MNTLSREEIHLAAQAALALTNPEDNSNRVPMKHAAGSLYLREVMTRVLQGEFEILPKQQFAPPPSPPMEPPIEE